MPLAVSNIVVAERKKKYFEKSYPTLPRHSVEQKIQKKKKHKKHMILVII